MKTKPLRLTVKPGGSKLRGAVFLLRGAAHMLCFPTAELTFSESSARLWFTVEARTLGHCAQLAGKALELAYSGKTTLAVTEWGRGSLPRW